MLDRSATCGGHAAAIAASASTLLAPYVFTGATPATSVERASAPLYTWSVERCTRSAAVRPASRCAASAASSGPGTLIALKQRARRIRDRAGERGSRARMLPLGRRAEGGGATHRARSGSCSHAPGCERAAVLTTASNGPCDWKRASTASRSARSHCTPRAATVPLASTVGAARCVYTTCASAGRAQACSGPRSVEAGRWRWHGACVRPSPGSPGACRTCARSSVAARGQAFSA